MKNYTPGSLLTNMVLALQASAMLLCILLPSLIRSVSKGKISFPQMLIYICLCIVGATLIFLFITAIELLFKSSRVPNAQIDGQNLIFDGKSIALTSITDINIVPPSLARRMGYNPIKLALCLDNDKRKLRVIEKLSLALIKDLKGLCPNAKISIPDKLSNFAIEPLIALVIGVLIVIFS